jgi:hypothetical protein
METIAQLGRKDMYWDVLVNRMVPSVVPGFSYPSTCMIWYGFRNYLPMQTKNRLMIRASSVTSVTDVDRQ